MLLAFPGQEVVQLQLDLACARVGCLELRLEADHARRGLIQEQLDYGRHCQRAWLYLRSARDPEWSDESRANWLAKLWDEVGPVAFFLGQMPWPAWDFERSE